MDERFHCLICGTVSLFFRYAQCEGLYLFGKFIVAGYLFKIWQFLVGEPVVVCKDRLDALFFLYLVEIRSDSAFRVRVGQSRFKEQCADDVAAVHLNVGLLYAVCHCVVEIRYRLTAVLVVLVGLYRDAGESRVAADTVGLAQKAVTGGEAAFEKLFEVYLTAGGGEGEEIEIVYVDIALDVCSGVFGVEHIHLVELLCSLRAVF